MEPRNRQICVGTPDCEPEIDSIVCRHFRPRRCVTHGQNRGRFGYVRFGSKADIGCRPDHVRFTP
jgi:hypothetical protein